MLIADEAAQRALLLQVEEGSCAREHAQTRPQRSRAHLTFSRKARRRTKRLAVGKTEGKEASIGRGAPTKMAFIVGMNGISELSDTGDVQVRLGSLAAR